MDFFELPYRCNTFLDIGKIPFRLLQGYLNYPVRPCLLEQAGNFYSGYSHPVGDFLLGLIVLEIERSNLVNQGGLGH